MNKELLIKIKQKGFFHIFSSNIINKLVQFGTSIILVRLLTKSEYGAFSYGMNILSMFLIFEGLGIVSGILQFCSIESDELQKKMIFKNALKVGVIFNFIVSVLIYIYTFYGDIPIEGSRVVLRQLAFVPTIVIIFDATMSYVRSKMQNKLYAQLNTFNTVIYFTLSILGATQLGVSGVIIAKYLSYILSIIISIIYLREDLLLIIRTNEKTISNKKFLKFSIISSLTNSISSLLYLLDTFLIGVFIMNSDVIATYKTATLIPFALNFIPLSVMTFAYPYFAKNSNDNNKIKKYYKILNKYMIIINFTISFVLIVFAPLIVNICFGNQYNDSISMFRLLSFGYFVAGTFRIPAGNILASTGNININFLNSILSGILNIVLDIVLINKYGAIGAAFATVTVFIFSSIISNGYLSYYLKYKKMS